MNVLDLIEEKKRGQHLSAEEIQSLIKGYTEDEVKDYQMAAFLMAVYFQGMNSEETAALTKSMVESGDQIDLSSVKGIKVDKHSTGGVGDTTTLVLGPILAACGLSVAKMSGRGLGHTGGTLDKLESIPNLNISLSIDNFIDATNKIGLAIAGQTANITPADKKLYALRDVTGTVDAIPLIASSIMSKKIAVDSDALVLDVKVGEGAFMSSIEEARQLAKVMVKLGHDFNRDTVAILTAMDQPLGKAIGNSLEVKEAIETLKGQGPEDLTELTVRLATRLIELAKEIDSKDAEKQVLEVIHNGQALEKFKEFVGNQNGDETAIDDTSKLPQASLALEVIATQAGYLVQLPAREVGEIARDLGAGRLSLDDTLDLGAGILLNKKLGDSVKEGEVLATLYGHDKESLNTGRDEFLKIIEISDHKLKKTPLIYEEIDYEYN